MALSSLLSQFKTLKGERVKEMREYLNAFFLAGDDCFQQPVD